MKRNQVATSIQTWILLAILSSTSSQLSAQSMREFAELERAAMDLIVSAGKSGFNNSRYAFTTPGGSFLQLAFMDGDTPIFRKSTNLRESDLIKATEARAETAVNGGDIEIGLWDNGRPYAHPEFSDRLSVADQIGNFPFSSHATHVAGTLVASGIDIEATGLAPAAGVVSYDWRYDYMEMFAEARDGLRVSNHSYSFATGWEEILNQGSFVWNYRTNSYRFGEYVVPAWFWDDVMFTNPYYLAVKAAGNEAGQAPKAVNTGHYHNGNTMEMHFDRHETDCADGYGCLGSLSTSKNALVVGAVTANGQLVADYSSRGPTLDGRIKPDVLSAGTGVYSTLGKDGYGVSSGTSMAAPTVAGSIALMLELEGRLFGSDNPFRSSTIKALLIHGADDVGLPGPDYQSGWGRVNIKKSIDLMDASVGGEVEIIEPTISDRYELDIYVSGQELKVTLAWIDPAGVNPNSIRNKSLPVLVEDFDVTVEKAGVVYYPFILDPVNPSKAAETGINSVDNVEQVRLEGIPNGPARIVVSRRNPTDVPLNVSLIVTGITDATGTPTSTPDLADLRSKVDVYPSSARQGQTIRVEARLEAVEAVVVDLFAPTGRIVERLYDGFTDRVDLGWTVPGSLAAGTYFLRISAKSMTSTLPITIVR